MSNDAKNASQEGRPDQPAIKGFAWESRGLCHVSEKKGAEGELVAVSEWIAPPFYLLGNVRDADSHQWAFLMAWNDLDKVRHEELIRLEDLAGDAVDVFRTFARGGLVVSPNPKLRRKLLEYLTKAFMRVKARARAVETLGWIEDGRAFVLPDGRVIGCPSERTIYLGERKRGASTAGSLQGWKEHVARAAVGNPDLAFAIAVAFCGPLLSMLRPDGGGGFNLIGQSSKGKSTALECALSAWENPDPLPTWRTTSNGLEGSCAARNDGFLPLDELGQLPAREAGEAAYMIASGRNKARMKKDLGAQEPKKWRLIFLSSGELGLEDKLGEDGRRVRAGQEVRVVDVPIPAEGIFRVTHGMLSPGHLSEHLKAQARKHFGHAAPAFIEKLCEERDHLPALVTKLREAETSWMASNLPPGSDGQVRRVAARFALAGVAGELAQSFGILPWPKGEAAKSASLAFRAWLDRRGHVGASERERGLQAVVYFLQTHGLARFAPWNDTDAKPAQMAGVRRESEGGGWDYLVHPTGWKELTKGFDSREVARTALEEGLLDPGPDGKPYLKLRTPHGQGQFYLIRGASLGAFREEVA